MPELRLNPELAKFIPPSTADERLTLRRLLLAEGCTVPLVGWLETGDLVDGHTRHRICEEEGIEYEVEWRSFPDIDAVKLFMLETQLGRRNITDQTRTLLVGMRVQFERLVGDKKGDVIKRVAGATKVSERTARRAEKLVDALDAHAAGDPVKRDKLLEEHTHTDIIKTAPLCERCKRVGPPPLKSGPCPACEDIRNGKPEAKRTKKKPKPQNEFDPHRERVREVRHRVRNLEKAVLALLTTKVGTHLMRLARSYDVPVVMDDKKATWPIAKRIQDMLSMLERTNFND